MWPTMTALRQIQAVFVRPRVHRSKDLFRLQTGSWKSSNAWINKQVYNCMGRWALLAPIRGSVQTPAKERHIHLHASDNARCTQGWGRRAVGTQAQEILPRVVLYQVQVSWPCQMICAFLGKDFQSSLWWVLPLSVRRIHLWNTRRPIHPVPRWLCPPPRYSLLCR